MSHHARRWAAAGCALVLAAVVPQADPAAQARLAIDPERSTVTIRVDRGGLFSVFGDNHLISGPVGSGWVSSSSPAGVEFRIDAAALRVLDPWLSESDRMKVQERMLGPDVLDVVKFPAITFASTSAESSGPDAWMVTGTLTMHGVSRDVRARVTRGEGRYRGSVRIRQRDFGITPVTVAMGTVRVKDEVVVEFEVATVARRLLRVHRLRAADAIHLASATLAAERQPASMSFVTRDGRLETAALREGFDVLVPSADRS